MTSAITESIAQLNTEVVGMSPAMATANFYQATAQALSNSAHNGTQTQLAQNTVLTAVMSSGSAMILSLAPQKSG